MVTICLIIIGSIITGISLSYLVEYEWHWIQFVFGPMLFILAFFVSILVLYVTAPIYSDYAIQSKVIYITALNDGSNTSGHFFLGCGTIKDKQIYSFYRDKGNGLSSRDYVYSENTDILQNGSIYNPYIIKLWSGWKSKNDFWFPTLGCGCGNDSRESGKYIIVVPPNTIKNDLILDNLN